MQCCDIILDTYKTRKEGKTAFDVDNSMKEKRKKTCNTFNKHSSEGNEDEAKITKTYSTL